MRTTLRAIGRTRAVRAAARAVFSKLVRIKSASPVALDEGRAEMAFRGWLMSVPRARVVELGTRRTGTGIPTTRRHWAGADAEYTRSDFMEGLDVDVVADAEELTRTFAPGSLDAVIACSVFEHIRRPWLAAAEIGRALRPGGKVYIQTHHTFPLHGYPHDYWRFTRAGLEALFGPEHGFARVESFYDFPVSVLSPRAPAIAVGETYLNVGVVAER